MQAQLTRNKSPGNHQCILSKQLGLGDPIGSMLLVQRGWVGYVLQLHWMPVVGIVALFGVQPRIRSSREALIREEHVCHDTL